MELSEGNAKDTRITELEVGFAMRDYEQNELATEKERNSVLEQKIVELKQRIIDLVLGFFEELISRAPNPKPKKRLLHSRYSKLDMRVLFIVNAANE